MLRLPYADKTLMYIDRAYGSTALWTTFTWDTYHNQIKFTVLCIQHGQPSLVGPWTKGSQSEKVKYDRTILEKRWSILLVEDKGYPWYLFNGNKMHYIYTDGWESSDWEFQQKITISDLGIIAHNKQWCLCSCIGRLTQAVALLADASLTV